MNDILWKTVQQTTSLLCVRALFEVAITHEENDVFTFSKKYGCKHITPSESKRLSLGSFLRYTFLDAKAIAIDFSIIFKHVNTINRCDEQCSLKKTKRSRSK